jgi:hypothetical protein
MKTVKFDVTYKGPAGRLELLIRWLWSIPSYIVAIILAIIGIIAMTLQFIHILFLGKRHPALHKAIRMFFDYEVQWKSYIYLLTDERNPILPEN